MNTLRIEDLPEINLEDLPTVDLDSQELASLAICPECGVLAPSLNSERDQGCSNCGAALAIVEERVPRRTKAGHVRKRKPAKNGLAIPVVHPPPVVQEHREESEFAAAMQVLHEAANNTGSAEEFMRELERRAPAQSALGRVFQELFGLEGNNAAMAQLVHLVATSTKGKDAVKTGLDEIREMLELIRSLNPKGGLESILAVQMVCVHASALQASYRARRADNSVMREANTKQSISLMRLSLQQIELMARLKKKISQQTVRVERVDVSGGQAVVGIVNPGGTPEG